MKPMDANRQAQARAVLDTEDAKKEFDLLCAMHPEATVFWDHDGRSAELQIGRIYIRIT